MRYKQTVLGATWVVLQPLLQTLIFTLLFHRAAGFEADTGIPYPIFSFAALLPWNMFAHALSTAGHSLVNNRSMLTKVYFPRLIIPLSPILASLVDFLIAFGVLIGMMLLLPLRPVCRLQHSDHPCPADAAVVPAAGADHHPGRQPVALGPAT